MRKRLVTLTIGALALPLLGGAAYAAAQGVSDRPSPQVVIPAARVADDSSGSRSGDDHPSTTLDDHGQDPTTTVTVDDHGDDPANHDQGDDKGNDPTATVDDHGDDPASHDLGDDHGDDPTITVTPPTSPTSPTTVDDHGDDPVNHDQADDHGHQGSDG